MNDGRYQIENIDVDRLAHYASVPSICHVRSMFEAETVDRNLKMHERPLVVPYVKDYDIIEGGPLNWPKRFNMTSWGLWLAWDSGQAVGAAAVKIERGDPRVGERSALLWDIRVRASRQRQGVGTALFRAAAQWARANGCALMEIETQNVNVAACRFYLRMGCVLHSVDHLAYRHCPQVFDEVMLTWHLRL